MTQKLTTQISLLPAFVKAQSPYSKRSLKQYYRNNMIMNLKCFPIKIQIVLSIVVFIAFLLSCSSAESDDKRDGNRENTDVAVTGTVSKLGITYAIIDGLVNLNLVTSSYTSQQIGIELSTNEDLLNPIRKETSKLEGNKITIMYDKLSGNTQYYYRTFVKINNLFYYGEKRSFTTKDFSNINNTGEASDITFTTANIKCKVDVPNIDKSDALTIGVAYSTSKELLHPDSLALSTNYYQNNIGLVISPITSIKDDIYIVNLDRLRNDTKYYYCSFTRAGNKYKCGEVNSFTTKPLTEFLITMEASDISAYSAIINGITKLASVFPNTSSIKYEIIYSNLISNLQYQWGNRVVLSQNGEELTGIITDLQSETVYHYCIVASLNNEYYYGETKVFKTKSGKDKGKGTVESPYTCSDAIHYAKSLGQAESENEVYVKGFITSITDEFSVQHGTASFVMSDTKSGTNKFTFWRCPYLGNKKFVNGDTQIKVGDEVIIYGKIVNYRGNTPETVQGAAFLYSLNGVTAGGNSEEPVGEAKGSGTLEDPFNAAAAIAYAKEVGEKESDKEVYIKGKVSSIAEQYGTEYGNGSFSISDDGEPVGEFYVHRALYLGNQKYTNGDLLKKYDEVIVCGKVYNYKGNTPETVQAKAYLYSLNGKTEAGGSQEGGEEGGQEGGEVSGNSITVVYADLGITDLNSPITLSDGTTLTFSQEDGKSAPIYHAGTKIIRMYAHNSVTIKANKKMASVIFNYDTYNGTAYKGNDEMYGEAGGNKISPTKDDKTVTFSNVNNATLKVVNDLSSDGGGTQFRCTGVTINYAE